jgi:uncharacterized protein (DUF885 family)
MPRLASLVVGAFIALAVVPTTQPSSYEQLVALHKDWRAFAAPRLVGNVPDYTQARIADERRGLTALQKKLTAIDPASWPLPQQIDYHLVRAEMNGMDFDHRVLRPWSRNPCFYTVIHPGDTDVPAREGPVHAAAINLWTYQFPLATDRLNELQAKLRAIPPYLEQARKNLTEDARDLYFLGARLKRGEADTLSRLAENAAKHHPALVPDIEQARTAVDGFRSWLEQRLKTMKASSGVGIDNYNWYLKNVHLVPYSWQDQVAMMQRELARARGHLALEENRNKSLPKLDMVATAARYHTQFTQAVQDFINFLKQREIFTVPDYAQQSLLEREGGFTPPDRLRDFFTQIEYRDSHPMRAHGTHWFDIARMKREPHASPIRRVPLLYNIWDTRAEGFATGFEEMTMTAGYLDDRPRARELIYIMLAQRAARAMGDLMMHANRWTLDEAVKYATDNTPYGWLSPQGNTVWFEQQLYLEQPSYGTSYVVGKIQIEKLLADRAKQLGDRFTLRQVMDEFHAAGMMPVSMIRWEMTGLDDEVRAMRQ